LVIVIIDGAMRRVAMVWKRRLSLLLVVSACAPDALLRGRLDLALTNRTNPALPATVAIDGDAFAQNKQLVFGCQEQVLQTGTVAHLTTNAVYDSVEGLDIELPSLQQSATFDLADQTHGPRTLDFNYKQQGWSAASGSVTVTVDSSAHTVTLQISHAAMQPHQDNTGTFTLDGTWRLTNVTSTSIPDAPLCVPPI
jgi:hypothetical protein